MSLKNDIVNAEILLDDLNRMAKDEGVNEQEYILDNGELVDTMRFGMDSMDFMTFYTCPKFEGFSMMVLGIYPQKEVWGAVGDTGNRLLISNENWAKKMGRHRHMDGEGMAAVYVILGPKHGRRGGHYIATTTSDGWSGVVDGRKYKIDKGGLIINWRTDPFEVKL